MKNFKALGLILFAALVGLAAAMYAAGWVSRQAGSSTTQVVVAAADIEPGSKLTGDVLSHVTWPTGAIPEGAFKDAAELRARVVKTGVLKGEPLLERKLSPAGTLGGLSAVITEGKRAMTVRVNDVVGVAGFALPGNYVDVVVNARQDVPAAGTQKEISKTVLERVLVLAVAQEAGRDETKPKVVSAVTLEVSPDEAEKLDLARSVGTLSLVLRNQVDTAAVKTSGATKNELFGHPAQPLKTAALTRRAQPVSPPPRTGPCVEVIQDGMRRLNCF